MTRMDEAEEQFAGGNAHAAEAAGRCGCQWCDNALECVGKNPLQAVFTAVVVGAVLGLLLCRRGCAPQKRSAEKDPFD